MRNTFILIFGILLIGCSTPEQQTDENGIQAFNDFLGKEKATAMNAAVESFDHFLLTNYSDHNNYEARVKAFLQEMYNYEYDSTWTLPTEKNTGILEDFETTGLRKEIWIYGNEEYQPTHNLNDLLLPKEQDSLPDIEMGELNLDLFEEASLSNNDSAEIAKLDKEMEERVNNSLHSNTNGDYLYGLAKAASSDTFVHDYVETKVRVGDISPQIVASAFLEEDINYDDPFIKQILVVEFYYWIMKWDVERL